MASRLKRGRRGHDEAMRGQGSPIWGIGGYGIRRALPLGWQSGGGGGVGGVEKWGPRRVFVEEK